MSVTIEQTPTTNRMPVPILINSNNTSYQSRNYPSVLSNPSSQRHHVSSNSSNNSLNSRSQQSPLAVDTKNHTGSSQGRRPQVKFAPLPDPRKLEEEEEFESTSPISDSDDPAYDDGKKASLIDALTGSLTSKLSLENVQSNSLIDGGRQTSKSKTSSPRWSTKRLLGPLLPKSTTSNAPSSYENSSGTLFRPSSMDSIRSTQSASNVTGERGVGSSSSTLATRPLGTNQRSASDLEQRRLRGASSAGSNNNTSAGGQLLSWMSPLTLTTSESGISSAKKFLSSNNTASSSYSGYDMRRTRSNSGTADASNNNKKRFMLNGRVYGTRRGGLTPDPNSLARATIEPEFVEWGSAGLGSVRQSSHSNPHSSHSGSSHAAAGGHGRTPVVAPAALGGRPTDEFQDDDGGGMAWVKKRKAARAQAQAEAQAEADVAKKAATVAAATADGSMPEKEEGDDGSDAAPSSSSTSASSNSIADSDESPSMEENPSGSTGSRTSEEEGENGEEYDIYDDDQPSIATPRARDSDVSSIPTIVINHYVEDETEDDTESRSQTPVASSPSPSPSPSLNNSSTTPPSASPSHSRSPSHSNMGAGSKPEHQTFVASVPPPMRQHLHLGHGQRASAGALHEDFNVDTRGRPGNIGDNVIDTRDTNSSSGSGSGSSSGEESDEDEEGDDEEEDEDDEIPEDDEEIKRLTAECAGREVFSKHRERARSRSRGRDRSRSRERAGKASATSRKSSASSSVPAQ